MKILNILNALNFYERRSNCLKKQVAAILYDNLWNIASVGYNRMVLAKGDKTCEHCCLRMQISECPALHAEIDCITKIGIQEIKRRGIKIMAVSYSPCPDCCKAIMNAGIEILLVKEPRLKDCGIQNHIDHSVRNYDQLAEALMPGIKYIRLWEGPRDTEIFTQAEYLKEAK